MKTKAYKVREMIARDIYKRLAPFCDEISVYYNPRAREHWSVDYYLKYNGNRSDYGMAFKFSKESDLIESSYGILLWRNYSTDEYTLMWSRGKEKKYRQYWNKKREEIIPRDWQRYTNCELMQVLEWTIDKAIKNKLI